MPEKLRIFMEKTELYFALDSARKECPHDDDGREKYAAGLPKPVRDAVECEIKAAAEDGKGRQISLSDALNKAYAKAEKDKDADPAVFIGGLRDAIDDLYKFMEEVSGLRHAVVAMMTRDDDLHEYISLRGKLGDAGDDATLTGLEIETRNAHRDGRLEPTLYMDMMSRIDRRRARTPSSQ